MAIATKDAPFINSLGMKFVPVPITGGPTDKQRLLFSTWETRVQDYEVFVKETKRKWVKPDFEQAPTHPAVMVSWEDAQAFCTWLTEKERKAGKVTGKEVYRLPSDHEWSCAVGIGEREDAAMLPSDNHETLMTVYPWGTSWPPKGKAGNYADQTFHAQFPAVRNEKESRVENEWIEGYTDGFATTAPVGSFPVNAYGLHDLGGNVQEWCADWLNKEQTERVLRGASWNHAESYVLRSTNRLRMNPSNRYRNNLGFRVVLAQP